MKSIEAIINSLRVAMTDARQNESHFESWMILNEAICDAIDALAEQPEQQEQSDSNCQDADGCPTEMAVLQRFWRGEQIPTEHYPVWFRPAQQQEQKLEFVSPGGGYVPAIPRPMPLDWKLVPRKATPEMLKAMDECAQEGYDERLYAGMASSVYMAAWDASPVLGTLPTSEKEDQMMDMIVGNLVREGINKHRARELADHFIKQCNYTNGYCTGRTDLLAEQTAQQQDPVAWINWSALTGERRLGWQCESELASEPLYANPLTQHQDPLCTAAMFDNAFLAKSGLDPNTKLYTSPQPSKPEEK